MAWQELGDGIFRQRYESLDLNVGLILSEAAALVIDSRATHGQAEELREDIRSLTSLPVTHLVNTHHHWDHTFGNAAFACEIVGHERCRSTLIERGEAMRQTLLDADWIPAEAKPHFQAVVITAPEVTFETSLTLTLGARPVTLTHLGRGHTDNDIIIEVDAVLFAGDLVEEGAPPQFGDAFPADWLETLSQLIARAPGTIVPGHGDVVGVGFVETQREQIARAIAGERVFPEQIMDQLRGRLEAEA
jgi:glyoxylase-like metal-dependent hydrolase (beta-lactamase superfamily II)